MGNLDPTIIAVIGTLFGASGLKVIEHWLARGKVRVDYAERLRDELRLEIVAQRQEIKDLEADLHKWREEYYVIRDKYIYLETKYRIAIRDLEDKVGLDTKLEVEERGSDGHPE